MVTILRCFRCNSHINLKQSQSKKLIPGITTMSIMYLCLSFIISYYKINNNNNNNNNNNYSNYSKTSLC